MKTHTMAGCGALLGLVLGGGSAEAADASALPAQTTQASHASAAIEYYPVMNAPPGSALPFSEAVRVGDMLYLSGAIGTDATGKLVAGGIAQQARQTMDNIGANLARHGSSFDGVVQCTVALADIKEWPAFNVVYRSYFGKHFPARMAYAATGLAYDARVEVQCNAVTGARQRL